MRSICTRCFPGPQLTDSTHRYSPGGTNAIGRAILVCLDKRTGRSAKFTIATPVKVIAKFGFTGQTTSLWDLRTHKTFSPSNYSGQPRYADSDVRRDDGRYPGWLFPNGRGGV